MSEKFSGSDATHWTTTYESSNGQVNDLCGKVGSGDHCHLWKDSEGKTGVEHRGHCKVCDDNSGK